MENQTVQSRAASLLRQAVKAQAPAPQPGEVTKPAEPAPAEPAATTN